jgi:acetate kinase
MTAVFVVNSGSSSLKYQLVDVETGDALVGGIVERIGEKGSAKDHVAAMKTALAALGDDRDIAAVGHRVVHGGTTYTEATLITDEVEKGIEELAVLAPLHNPANLIGIRAARAALPDLPQVAVFDTAFHRTLGPDAFTYAIDAELAAKHSVRRYGFHGTSFKYVSEEAARFLGRPLDSLKMIVLHLGNGASACAIDGGRSIDTSMGMTPLEGLVMGTRSGHLHRQAGLDFEAVDELLNRKSGLLGLAGSGDMRDIQKSAVAGDERAKLALAVYLRRIRGYIGSYLAQLGSLDAVVFTAGVGEHSPEVRAGAIDGLAGLGMTVDDERNSSGDHGPRFISPRRSPVAVLVIPTNEELEIARQTVHLVG